MDVDRVEVIEIDDKTTKRVYVNHDVEQAKYSIQDDGKTMKLFVFKKIKEE